MTNIEILAKTIKANEEYAGSEKEIRKLLERKELSYPNRESCLMAMDKARADERERILKQFDRQDFIDLLTDSEVLFDEGSGFTGLYDDLYEGIADEIIKIIKQTLEK